MTKMKIKSIKTGLEQTVTEKEYSALIEQVGPNKFQVISPDTTPPEAKAATEKAAKPEKESK
jgi:hypothetical protein